MVQFARCNALLSLAMDASGKGCRYVAKGASGDDVLKDMGDHLQSVHQVNPTDMKLNIMASTKATRS